MNTSQILLFAVAIGVSSQSLVAQQAPAIDLAPKINPNAEVGVSSRDGISVSGADVLVTRNGRTEKLMKEIVLSNGFRVRPDGTVMVKEGGVMTLRPSQVLTFEGELIDPPVVESVAPKKPLTVVQPQPPAAPPMAPATPMPMPRQGPIKAGEAGQK